ncbi:MAG: amidase [Dehalococcoidia bacterium]|nr:amidase [Dehalococcoidia bacterium]
MKEIPLTIKDAAAALRNGSMTSVELTRAAFARADALDPTLQIYITRMDESAMAEAERADAAFAIGLDKGPLQGIPVGLKDILSTENAPTTAQSLVMDPNWSAQGDGPAVARLRQAGAVIAGKAATHEYACGGPDFEKPFPIPRNPWNQEYHCGGSSSGSGAGVSAGFFLGALGTDTSGSVRWPAAACGVSGMMGSFGRVPKSGCTQNGFSLDHIGPLARSAWDCAAMMEVISGFDATDINSSQNPVPRYTDALDGDLSGMRVAVVRDGYSRLPDTLPECSEAFEEAVRVFEAAGARVEEITIPHIEVFKTAQLINNSCEKSAIYLRRFQDHWEDWGRFTRVGMSSMGLFYNAADYLTSLRVRRYAVTTMRELMAPYDVVLTPTFKGHIAKLAEMGYMSRHLLDAHPESLELDRRPGDCCPDGLQQDRAAALAPGSGEGLRRINSFQGGRRLPAPDGLAPAAAASAGRSCGTGVTGQDARRSD